MHLLNTSRDLRPIKVCFIFGEKQKGAFKSSKTFWLVLLNFFPIKIAFSALKLGSTLRKR